MIIDTFGGAHSWLSNFHLCDVVYEGDLYASSEHAYQAAKVPRNGRLPFRVKGLSCGDVKRLGRRVTARQAWDTARNHVMEAILLDKFTRNPYLAERLIGTGDAELIEGNHWGDIYWGRCRGEGQNHLGRLLMELRSRLSALSDTFAGRVA